MNKVRIISFIIIFLFSILTLGLINLNVVHGRGYQDLSRKNCIRLLPRMGARGRIFDSSGKVIVDNKLSYDVMILPQSINQIDKELTVVSRILGLEFKDLKSAFKSSIVAPSVPVAVAKNIALKKAIILEELKVDLPDVFIQPNPVRYYPYQGLASHVVGYVNEIDRWRLTKLADYGYKTKDIVGFGGVEEKYDWYLREEEGGLSQEVDHRGRFVRILGFRPPQNGRDVQLTLNMAMQKIAENRLSEKKGCVILMDPDTGEVLAMASFPDFNPAVFVNKSGSAISGLVNNSDAPLMNRAISGIYPPGSVFKVIVAAVALESHKISPSTTFACNGGLLIGNRNFACWNTHGEEDLLSAITHSCDVFFYRTGLLAGAQNIHDYALKFGLAKSVPFELPYGQAGFIPSPLWRKINRFRNWFDGDTANLSIGQGDCLTTPLQITRMMAVFANKGYLVNPYIVKKIGEEDISAYQRRQLRLSLKISTLNQIREGLRKVVSDPTGTAHILSDLPVSVAAKTGTAQTPSGQPHAWCCGFFPFENPKFVICVVLEHGGSGHNSCVVAKEIIEEMSKEGLI